MEKLKILVCAHKKSDYTRTKEPFFPVQAGKALHPDLNLGFACDNTGDNISDKNSHWSELTVLYWGWKNIKNVEYLGLNHYRRYFNADINAHNIDNLMGGADLIVAKSANQLSQQERPDNLAHMTSQEDYYIFADTFLEIHPDYKDGFMRYFYHSRSSYPYTMFIAKKEIYDKFCEFMFPVFFAVEKRLKEHGYSRQKRTIGYFGEFSLGLFVTCFNLKVRRMPVLFYDAPQKHSIAARLLKGVWAEAERFLDGFRPTPNDIPVPADVKAGLLNDGINLKNLR